MNLTITQSAAKRVAELILKRQDSSIALRVSVDGGGCSGFQYGFSFDENANEDDTVVSNNGAQLLVDPLSFQYLVGSRVDYTEGLEGSRFVVENPLATTTCGCGMSFSM